MNIGTSAKDADMCDWYNEGNNSPGMWSPPSNQRGPTDVEEVEDEETQDMHMTVECTQGARHEAPLYLWAGFESAVRQFPAAAEDRDGGWVPSKREQGGCAEYGANAAPQIGTSEGPQHATLNLNFSPGRVKDSNAVRVRGESAEGRNSVVNIGGQRRGTGRGTTRARRPAPVDPRFHSTASTPTSSPVDTCVLLFNFVSMQEHGKV